MNNISTLLVDIEHPGLTEPLRLMCGREFSVLRTDNTGRDIYGFAHQGREYLLVPFSFAADGENTLAMTIPPTYEEWFMDMNMDGARISFASPHGEPLFVSLTEEYQSGSGVLGIDDQGGISITMDKADPARRAAFRARCGNGEEKREAGREHGAPCACGHDHHGHDGHGPCNHEDGHAHSQHEKAVRVHVGMSDQELADTIRKRIDGLNLLLKQAIASGLEVDIMLMGDSGTSSDATSAPLLAVRKVARLL